MFKVKKTDNKRLMLNKIYPINHKTRSKYNYLEYREKNNDTKNTQLCPTLIEPICGQAQSVFIAPVHTEKFEDTAPSSILQSFSKGENNIDPQDSKLLPQKKTQKKPVDTQNNIKFPIDQLCPTVDHCLISSKKIGKRPKQKISCKTHKKNKKNVFDFM